ncbi:hypothetical protein [Dechloromonas denitrificans]|uniref:hypothetical protein n=1 Tax=Dechloromonas denitrificans TaxID=281362 RepID=UPI001CF90867|nr:hypothetical protein [Dechloromonas denitrificans]UCV03039.1 hypothetical protein KI611_18475 [Dechloromonas denitrificans]
MIAKKAAPGKWSDQFVVIVQRNNLNRTFSRSAKTGQVYLAKNILQCTKLFAHKADKVISGHHHEATGETAWTTKA